MVLFYKELKFYASAVVGYSIFQTVTNIACLLIWKGKAIVESQILLVQNWKFFKINNGDTCECSDLKPAPLSS